jgi:hypothetical protein
MDRDLELTPTQRSVFWAIFRVGFMHQAMGQAGNAGWLVSDQYTAKPVFRNNRNQQVVCLDPWKFVDRVIDEFRRRPELITASESFPLAEIFSALMTE